MPRRNLNIAGRPLALDARPDRLDLRDRVYAPLLGSLPARWPTPAEAACFMPEYAKAGLIRDQGEDGACTGFGLASVIDYLHFVRAMRSDAGRAQDVRRASAAMLYELARLYDEWPGEDYDGSSCRGALKGWHRHGVCREPLWPYELRDGERVFVRPSEDERDRDDAARNWDIDALQCTIGVYYRIDARSIVDMQAAIYQVGAIYCSATVHEGWDVATRNAPDSHAVLPRIEHIPSPQDPGGHAFAIVGYDECGFVVQNSWGTDWGACGFAILPYADWVTHGTDAWVFTLGVPAEQAHTTARGERVARSPRHMVPASDPGVLDATERPAGLVAARDSIDRRYREVPAAVRPLDTDAAYRHALVLDRGFPVRNDFTARDAEGAVERVGYECPTLWLRKAKSHKLLIYAHGGLNSETASITRIRTLAPYALDSGIYPIFVTWRSGPLETLSDLVEEQLARLGFGVRGVQPATGWLDRLADRTDLLLEPILRAPGGALWQQMKLNAVRASDHALGGCRALVQQLARLVADDPALEIHLIGHSAGAIVLGSMLARMREAGLRAASLRLLAPACTVRFALKRFKTAIDFGTLDPARFHIHTLSDENEQADAVGPYRKSLLYLVSRSFETVHKMPLLGLEKAFDATTLARSARDDLWAGTEVLAARDWLAYWSRLGVDATNRRAHVLAAHAVSTGTRSIAASHGCFDNAVDIVGDALGYIVDPSNPQRVKIHQLDD